MSTGVSVRKGKSQKSIPVSLEYQGKKTEEFYLKKRGSQFQVIKEVGGGGPNMFFFSDNADAMRYMLEIGYTGKIDLVYIDPPFSTSQIFVNRSHEQAYSDFIKGGEFVEFIRERLILLRELLSQTGSIYVHLDGNMAFRIKIIMDELFGEDNCRAFITRRKCSTKNYTKNTYGDISDYVLFYSKSNTYKWNRPFTSWDEEKFLKEYPFVDEETGRRYKKVPIHAPGVRKGETGLPWRGKFPPEGKHWQYTPTKLDEFDKAGEIYWSSNGNPRRKVFCDEKKGIPIQNIWLDYRDFINQTIKTTGYPTEKNIDMLKMIVGASSNPGDLILDCFAGSGTTLEAAQELGRIWIGVDNSIESYKAIYKRFTSGVDIYGDYVNSSKRETIKISQTVAFTVLSDNYNKKVLEEEKML